MGANDMHRRKQAIEAQLIAEMFSPVRCNRCRGVYDLGKVEVTARYSDCTVFKTPCCGSVADDRTWKGRPDFTQIDKDDPRGGDPWLRAAMMRGEI